MKIQIGNEVRDMTADELESYKLFLADVEKNKQVAELAQSAKESALAKLAKLGLTQEEIKALYEI